MRGPAVLPGAFGGVTSVPPRPTKRQRFDELVLGIVAEIERRWHEHLVHVEYAVEDTPLLPSGWAEESAPLSSLVREEGQPARIVLFRRPIEHRATGHDELAALVLTVLVEQVAELLGVDPEAVDPRYSPDD